MALTVSEQWVRQRVGLEQHNLVDVRSLNLPGNYQEKITNLGNSLKSFVRLKSLDLSRNALVTLQGIEQLKHLEKLNLYYNKIPSLKEVFCIRNLTALKDLDLRLNPVSKNEADYRLFVVHMLPNLRRLDDRPVRDSERKAALMHFCSDQAYEFHDPLVLELETERQGHPRAAFVSSLAKKCSALDADDEAVLNLISKCNWDLNKPCVITGSAKNIPDADMHTLQDIRDIDNASSFSGDQEPTLRTSSQQNRPQPLNIPKATASSQKRHCVEFQDFSEGSSETVLPKTTYPSSQGHQHHKSAVPFPYVGTLSAAEINGQNQEMNGQPSLQPHNSSSAIQSKQPVIVCTASSRQDKSEDQNLKKQFLPQRTFSHDHFSGTHDRTREAVHPATSEVSADTNATLNPTLMEHFLDLVDKYWNGFKSLHCNETFLNQARIIWSAMLDGLQPQSEPKSDFKLQEQVSHLKEKNEALQASLSHQEQHHSENLQKLRVQFMEAEKDVEMLRDRLTRTLEEKNILQNHVIKLEHKVLNVSNSSNQHLEELQSHNQNLQSEIENLKEKLQCCSQIQELTQMLQESHRTLVSTNEHLLRELNETRSRHKAEVDQLHWSYIQLKKSIQVSPTASSGLDQHHTET
ncbi:centrosomal protein of 72 kDa isoform X2 [Callorhinchus milii]|uniref:centrosomal protein of 72 kDa isoform X2 n=1 Tax=Callorhinchus milii TaxID=7868 RepID=UPI001C3F68CC|nr:centrosomal protein of 72 kDa isoform X2 [Callorhinchus milii]